MRARSGRTRRRPAKVALCDFHSPIAGTRALAVCGSARAPNQPGMQSCKIVLLLVLACAVRPMTTACRRPFGSPSFLPFPVSCPGFIISRSLLIARVTTSFGFTIPSFPLAFSFQGNRAIPLLLRLVRSAAHTASSSSSGEVKERQDLWYGGAGRHPPTVLPLAVPASAAIDSRWPLPSVPARSSATSTSTSSLHCPLHCQCHPIPIRGKRVNATSSPRHLPFSFIFACISVLGCSSPAPFFLLLCHPAPRTPVIKV